MKTFEITAESVTYLKNFIEAENEEEALKTMNEMLENGEMAEDGIGSIRNKSVQCIA